MNLIVKGLRQFHPLVPHYQRVSISAVDITSSGLMKETKEQTHAEETLLRRYLKSTTSYSQCFVPAGVDKFLNTILINEDCATPDKEQTIPLVLTHGFGSGVGFWFRNLQALSTDRTGSDAKRLVVAVDWLGMGRSTRTKFVKRSICCRPNEVIEESEDYFVDSLEEWRKNMGYNKINLVGHSLGGYLSAVYALKYPDRVANLVLASPVGLPNPPIPIMESSSTSVNEKQSLSFVQKLFVTAWHSNITPQGVVRAFGPWGKKVTQNVVDKRFGDVKEDDRKLIAEYLYGIVSDIGTGEYAMNSILFPVLQGNMSGVFARHPIGERLNNAGENFPPTTILFGDKDWMFHPLTMELPLITSKRAKLTVIPNAGHHLYLDNSEAFHEAVLSAIKD